MSYRYFIYKSDPNTVWTNGAYNVDAVATIGPQSSVHNASRETRELEELFMNHAVEALLDAGLLDPNFREDEAA